MIVSVMVAIGGENITVSLNGGDIVIAGGSSAIMQSVSLIAESALEEYSPAMGGKGSYLAAAIREQTGARILSVDEPQAEKGVVY